MWMNRSLKYGILIIPYGPMKVYWATRKVRLSLIFSLFKINIKYIDTQNVRIS